MKTVWVTTSFPAFHKWPEAPSLCSFLREKHRHVFHVKMWFEVSHEDRDIEFITMKYKVDNFITRWREKDLGAMSCEMMATELMEHFGALRASVSEDNENGAEICQK